MNKLRVWLKNENRFSYHDLTIAEDVGGLSFILEENMPIGKYQFSTSLLDKNGKEIYEGDIAKCGEDIGIVKWFGANFQVNWCPVSSYATYLLLCADKSEIIGNIYENPDLLSPTSNK